MLGHGPSGINPPQARCVSNYDSVLKCAGGPVLRTRALQQGGEPVRIGPLFGFAS